MLWVGNWSVERFNFTSLQQLQTGHSVLRFRVVSRGEAAEAHTGEGFNSHACGSLKLDQAAVALKKFTRVQIVVVRSLALLR